VSKLKYLKPGDPVVERPGLDRLLEGNPEFRSWSSDPDEPLQVGFWAATPGLHRMDRTGAGIEHFYLLEGEIELTEDGAAPRRFATGDLVRIDPDFQGTWRTISPVRKIFFYVDP
jgi:uncharacterized cupin superfamily protein